MDMKTFQDLIVVLIHIKLSVKRRSLRLGVLCSQDRVYRVAGGRPVVELDKPDDRAQDGSAVFGVLILVGHVGHAIFTVGVQIGEY